MICLFGKSFFGNHGNLSPLSLDIDFSLSLNKEFKIILLEENELFLKKYLNDMWTFIFFKILQFG